jgi:acylphosphatase
MADDRIVVRARVTGRVQGVWYRGWARDEAERLRLSGWVRNEPDGSVSALLAGPAPQVARMIEAMRRGPPDARVAAVTTEPADDVPTPPGFHVRR